MPTARSNSIRGIGMATLMALLVMTVGACADSSAEPEAGSRGAGETSRPSRLVDPATFAESIREPDRVTINVHVPYEGDVPGSDLSVPFDAIAGSVDELPAVGTPLAIYCRTGSMSAEAAPALAQLGYDDIVELDGGMVAWQADGRRLLHDR